MKFRIAISVDEPFYSGYSSAVPFTQVFSFNNSRNSSFCEICYKLISVDWLSSWSNFPHHILVNVMIFIVNVPVLSEQMLLAPPIVSHASIFRTRFSSTSIFFTENARDNVTAKGKPSGIATTITVMARIKKFRSSGKSDEVFHYLEMPFSIEKRIKRITRIKIAE